MCKANFPCSDSLAKHILKVHEKKSFSHAKNLMLLLKMIFHFLVMVLGTIAQFGKNPLKRVIWMIIFVKRVIVSLKLKIFQWAMKIQIKRTKQMICLPVPKYLKIFQSLTWAMKIQIKWTNRQFQNNWKSVKKIWQKSLISVILPFLNNLEHLHTITLLFCSLDFCSP